ncbi:MAG: hypothetical protein ACK6AT_11095, partial [Planctomycetota bacterium]
PLGESFKTRLKTQMFGEFRSLSNTHDCIGVPVRKHRQVQVFRPNQTNPEKLRHWRYRTFLGDSLRKYG